MLQDTYIVCTYQHNTDSEKLAVTRAKVSVFYKEKTLLTMEDRNTNDIFIQMYKKSEKRFVEDRVDNINKVLNNNTNNANLKKCRYIIRGPKENYEYYKTIYYSNNKLIIF